MIIKDGAGVPEKVLRRLWQEAFGDPDSFLDLFFATAYAPERCRVAMDGELLSALYWLDCSLEGRPVAYIYAAATHKAHRGKGVFRRLLEDTHSHLQALGYDSVMLVSAKGLEGYYGTFGYRFATGYREFTCRAGESPVCLQPVTAAEYGHLRRPLLPKGAVLQEGAGLAFLEKLARLYRGENCLLAVYPTEGKLLEYLGDAELLPGVLKALDIPTATVRTPGTDDRAMWKPLQPDALRPTYFAFAFE